MEENGIPTSSKKASKPPRLHTDLLIQLADKMLFSPGSGTNFENNLTTSWKSNLMYINNKCTSAFVQPFTKCKNFEYHNNEPGDNDDNAAFYLSKDQYTKFFTVTRGFIIGLVERNKLNINSIKSTNLFSRFKDHPKMIPTLDKGESCEQTFSKLFLIRDTEDAKIMLGAKNPLTFGNVEFRDNYQALEHIDLILNLNACSISIEVSNVPNSNYYYPLPDAPVAKPVAERIKKLSIKYNIEPEPPLENDAGFNSEKWLAFINYVLSACPNLELLKIHVINQTFPTSPLPFDSRIELISKSINCVVGQIFPSLDENVHSRVIIEFQDNFSRWSEDSLDGKEVLKIGEPNTENVWLADGEVARVVKYINPKNGSEYQCRLSVYSADDDDNSVLQNQAAWDNLDDDFNDEYEYEFDNDYDGECGDDYDVDFEEDFDFDPELGYDYD